MRRRSCEVVAIAAALIQVTAILAATEGLLAIPLTLNDRGARESLPHPENLRRATLRPEYRLAPGPGCNPRMRLVHVASLDMCATAARAVLAHMLPSSMNGVLDMNPRQRESAAPIEVKVVTIPKSSLYGCVKFPTRAQGEWGARVRGVARQLCLVDRHHRPCHSTWKLAWKAAPCFVAQ